jgi:hypothetical protein
MDVLGAVHVSDLDREQDRSLGLAGVFSVAEFLLQGRVPLDHARGAPDLDPPTYLRSMTATFCPWEATAQARYLSASPLPSTTTSSSSAMHSVTFRKGLDGGAKGPGEEWAPRGRA